MLRHAGGRYRVGEDRDFINIPSEVVSIAVKNTTAADVHVIRRVAVIAGRCAA